MRVAFDPQGCLAWATDSPRKVVREYQEKYQRISTVLDENPSVLALAHQDLKTLSKGSEAGKQATYTSENLLRALIVHQVEGTSLRETIIRIAESDTLRDFVRLGTREVMDYSFLDRSFNALQPTTWTALNDALAKTAAEKGQIDPSAVRSDTTVVEAHIHYPTDTSLLWDGYRVLTRLLRQGRALAPESCPHRFHDKKARKHHLFVTRYMSSRSKDRKRQVKKRMRQLLGSVGRVVGIARGFLSATADSTDLALVGLRKELEQFLPRVCQVLQVVERIHVRGENVPAREKIFSVFEAHVELIRRGKRSKPIEFGHVVEVTQTPEKFITDYQVFERRIEDKELTEPMVDRHEARFGQVPEAIAEDGGYWLGEQRVEALKKRGVKVVAIPKHVKDWGNEILAQWQQFRAGIEGSISVLKRAFRLFRCYYRGFKNFESCIGLAVFAHNLVNLAGCPDD